MPVYSNSEQLERVLRSLIANVSDRDSSSSNSVVQSGMVMRLRLTSPDVQVVINGRKNPVQITYGSTHLRPDLDVELTSDALHFILLRRLTLRKAIAEGKMKVRGPFWKSYPMREIFQQGQLIYPQVARDVGIEV